MPTGYTADVANGSVTDLRTWALQVARGMGALVTMRDEPRDAPIPFSLEPSTSYHDQRLEESRARLAELQGMSEIDRAAACAAYNAKALEDRATRLAENNAERDRYDAMIAKVKAWSGAPEGIREFMMEQLNRGRDFDCGGDPTEYMPDVKDVGAWFHDELDKAARDIGYHEGERAKEIARTAERNAWLRKLHDSLAGV